MEDIKIAVIGLGPAGLTALKTLREEGFDVVAFERRDKIGGLWAFSDSAVFTSAVDETVCNVSKFASGFSDYPLAEDYPPYPTAPQMQEHFSSYASHFHLLDHVRLNTTVRRVTRNTSEDAWDVHVTDLEGDATLSFDKIVFGHGCESVPVWPSMPNRDKFKGEVIHSQAYKSSLPFRGKKVLVVGIGNTACDISLALRKHTAKLYQSFRRGKILVSRYTDDGIPLDTEFPWPMMRLKYFLDDKMPRLMATVADRIMTNKMISDAARFEPAPPGVSRNERLKRAAQRVWEDWRLLPGPSMARVNPTVQEDFIPALHEGDITPVRGFKDFVGDRQVLLDDDTTVEVDAVIFCTGYEIDFSIMPELEMDGAGGLPLKTAGGESRDTAADPNEVAGEDREDSEKPRIPRLFQMIFPPRRASSVAFLSWMTPQEPVWCVYELASMAIAQIWAAETAETAKSGDERPRASGYRSPALLPSLGDMSAQVDAHHDWWRGEWEKDHSTLPGYVRSYTFYRFLHDAAGTGLYDKIDHALTGRGWGLWWNDRELWTWLAKGPMNNYSWRLFETNPDGVPGCGRKTWPDARKALREAYESCEEFKRQARTKQ
ncbi:FAD/NAD(P)-binding domain-containing protein [Annulohypoxylon bovei var. microspora]|nr:FAD/NAD(P)-binding domain-containing protein [Annulohypoxylon bovei var. microspora]